MKFITFFSMLISVYLAFSQEAIYVEIDSTYFQGSPNGNELVINKPASKKVIYVFRFQGIKIPDFAQRNVAYSIELFYFPVGNDINRDKTMPEAFYLFKVDSADNLRNEYLEMQVIIPENRFRTEDEVIPISSSFLSESYDLKKAINLRIVYEQPDVLSATQWEDAMLWSFKTLGASYQGDHFEIYTRSSDSYSGKTYKVQLKPTEKLVIFYRRNAISRLGLIHIPLRFDFSKTGIAPKSRVNFSNLGLSFGIANFSSAVYYPNGQIKHRNLGFGTFISPSLRQEVLLYSGNLFRSNSSFLGLGITLNYSVNGLGFHFIPLAYDILLESEFINAGPNSGNFFMGFGIGYQPFFNRKY